MVSGCDFFRSVLGKPTSKDIERMRVEAEIAERKAEEDRLKAEQEAIALAEAQRKLEEAEALKQAQLERERYYVIYGSFKHEGNADKLYARLANEGHKPRKIRFRNGFTLIATNAFENEQDAMRELYRMRDDYRNPYDMWVYDKRQGRHVSIDN